MGPFPQGVVPCTSTRGLGACLYVIRRPRCGISSPRPCAAGRPGGAPRGERRVVAPDGASAPNGAGAAWRCRPTPPGAPPRHPRQAPGPGRPRGRGLEKKRRAPVPKRVRCPSYLEERGTTRRPGTTAGPASPPHLLDEKDAIMKKQVMLTAVQGHSVFGKRLPIKPKTS